MCLVIKTVTNDGMAKIKNWVKHCFHGIRNKPNISKRQNFKYENSSPNSIPSVLPFKGTYNKMIVMQSCDSTSTLNCFFDFEADPTEKDSLRYITELLNYEGAESLLQKLKKLQGFI